jgi:HAD superfamily hydrolase (TIGR01484 family)
MTAPKPKLMVFDLDGTLAESKQRVSAEVGELLSTLMSHMPVAIMSGASFAQFETQFFPALPTEAIYERLFIFPVNAAQCFVYVQRTWHPEYDHAFSDTERSRIHAAIEEGLNETGMAMPEQVWGDRVQDRGAQITFSAVGQLAPVEAKRAWAALYNVQRKKLRDMIAQKLPNFSVSTGGITSIDITPKGINKAYGIRRLTELTGISVADMLYVGDALEEGGNDSVVIDTGIRTHAVFGPEETAALIETMLKHCGVKAHT